MLLKGFSQAKVAETLGYHLGSIRKRIDKIEEILEIRLPRKPYGRKPKQETILTKNVSSNHIYSMTDIDEKREALIIKGILSLEGSKNASEEQLMQIGEYYNIDSKKLQEAIQKEGEER